MKILISIIIFLVVVVYTLTLPKKSAPQGSGDYVVLVHGIARSSSHMRDLENAFKNAGYEVINVDYPSRELNIEGCVGYVRGVLSEAITKNKQVHFIGHSLGGLIVRVLAQDFDPSQRGKVVQIAPPNKGSEVADSLKDWFIFREFFGPAGQELGTQAAQSVQSQMKPIHFPMGVIAGNESIDPVSSKIIPGEDDGKVSIRSTSIDGMSDHIVLSSSHTFITGNKEAIAQALHFVEHGYFKRN